MLGHTGLRASLNRCCVYFYFKYLYKSHPSLTQSYVILINRKNVHLAKDHNFLTNSCLLINISLGLLSLFF